MILSGEHMGQGQKDMERLPFEGFGNVFLFSMSFLSFYLSINLALVLVFVSGQ